MSDEALILFVRRPALGKVKTRLAAAIGPKAALTVYKDLLQHTLALSLPLACDKFVFYADAVDENDCWNGYCKKLQHGSHLGQRMESAFADVFAQGYKRVVIVGSDCFELTTAMVENAFHLLQTHDVVVGPAKDGGYYLLGMKDNLKKLFDDINWSTATVLQQTEEKLKLLHANYTLLPVLTDVDTVEDLPVSMVAKLQAATEAKEGKSKLI